MIPDFLVRLVNLATNGTITHNEYTTIYNIITEADRRQKNSVYKELAEKLNEQYKDKLVCEHIGCYHCFGYPTTCEHDVLFVQVDYTKISQNDLIELETLGFRPCEDLGNMMSFRYGSC